MLLEKSTNEKYSPSIEEINQKYDNLEKTTKENYDKLETEIKENYDKQKKEITSSISSVEYSKTKEFMANGFSKKYYQLQDKWDELYSQKSELDSKEREEISNNNSLETKELSKLEQNKKTELKTVEENKKLELTRLKEKKEQEVEKINNQNIDKSGIRNKGLLKIIIGIVIILMPLLYIISVFNKLTRLANKVKEAWSQVDVLLKQRSDMIPNIVEAVKGFSTHEKGTLTQVTKARNQVINASTKEEEITANKNLSSAINRLLFLQEDYPELKADTNFIDLQNNLKELENNISIYRQLYNRTVLKYKNKLEMFPPNIVANIFNFKPEVFFEVEEIDKENPNISFN